jgi:hypothetical protein
MQNKGMFIIGSIVFIIYVFFYFKIVLRQKFFEKKDKDV